MFITLVVEKSNAITDVNILIRSIQIFIPYELYKIGQVTNNATFLKLPRLLATEYAVRPCICI